MNKQLFKNYSISLFKFYPIFRQTIYKAFDLQTLKLTRTQQTILMALSDIKTMNMSQLACSISTSNEQATRAVAQLVDSGFIKREQNALNRRVINISLTDKANDYLKTVLDTMVDLLSAKYSDISEDELMKLTQSLEIMNRVFHE